MQFNEVLWMLFFFFNPLVFLQAEVSYNTMPRTLAAEGHLVKKGSNDVQLDLALNCVFKETC